GFMCTQQPLQRAAQEAAHDIEGKHQQSDLEPQPIAPRQELQHGDDDANDEGERAPDDPSITPAPWRIQIGPPAHHQADAQRGDHPAGIAYKIKQHGYSSCYITQSVRRPSGPIIAASATSRLTHDQDVPEPATDETANGV